MRNAACCARPAGGHGVWWSFPGPRRNPPWPPAGPVSELLLPRQPVAGGAGASREESSSGHRRSPIVPARAIALAAPLMRPKPRRLWEPGRLTPRPSRQRQPSGRFPRRQSRAADEHHPYRRRSSNCLHDVIGRPVPRAFERHRSAPVRLLVRPTTRRSFHARRHHKRGSGATAFAQQRPGRDLPTSTMPPRRPADGGPGDGSGRAGRQTHR
jgi:hypothetical protein